MRRDGAIASTVLGLTRALGNALVSEQLARQPGLLQSLDPRVRVVGLFALVLAVTLSHRIGVVVALFLTAVMLASVVASQPRDACLARLAGRPTLHRSDRLTCALSHAG